MNKFSIIKRILILAAWLLVICGITTLLVAANQEHSEKLCKEIVVGIRGTGELFYVEEADIISQLVKAKGKLVNRPVSQISTELLESLLEKNQWIKDAELYFDSKDVLHVFVEEREPVARIFTVDGYSFYIDSSGHRMPLLPKLNARVPVITGFPVIRSVVSKDSLLMEDVKKLATYIYSHPFWNAQTGQVDITADGKFEILPLIGDHIIKIGSADHLEAKLDKLMLFYKRVLTKAGINKYAVIDVQFNGQVIGVHRGTVSKVDSIQLQKNIAELLERSRLQNISAEPVPVAYSARDTIMPATVTVPVKTNPIPSENPLPAKQNNMQVRSNPVKTIKHQNNGSSSKPKAVMPKRNG